MNDEFLGFNMQSSNPYSVLKYLEMKIIHKILADSSETAIGLKLAELVIILAQL